MLEIRERNPEISDLDMAEEVFGSQTHGSVIGMGTAILASQFRGSTSRRALQQQNSDLREAVARMKSSHDLFEKSINEKLEQAEQRRIAERQEDDRRRLQERIEMERRMEAMMLRFLGPTPTSVPPSTSPPPSVDRPIAAIRAITDMETQYLLNGLLLFKSNFTEEQLQIPVLQFFNENLPNLMVKKSEKNGQYEVVYKDTANELMNQTEDRNMHASLLRRLSSAYSCSSTSMPSFAGFEVSGKGVGNSLLGSDDMLMEDFDPEMHKAHMLGLQEGLKTPGATNHRLSLRMTPKTRRLPNLGEMLHSVHGSPLGVMEAINESEES